MTSINVVTMKVFKDYMAEIQSLIKNLSNDLHSTRYAVMQLNDRIVMLENNHHLNNKATSDIH